MAIRGFKNGETSQTSNGFEFKTLEEILEEITRLYRKDSIAKTILGPIFSKFAKGNPGELDLDTCALHVNPQYGSIVQPKNAMLDGRDAYAFIKSTLANPAIVFEGLKLEIVGADGQPKNPQHYTEADLRNLALCVVAAQENGLNITNEDHIFQNVLKGKFNFVKDAQNKWNDFKNATYDPSNPAFKGAREKLDTIGQGATVGKMRGTLNSTSGQALKSAGYMTKDDFDKVGVIQADLLVIRNAMKGSDGKYDPEKLKLLPQFKGAPDLGGLINNDAARAKLIADLGVKPEDITAALAITNGGKGVAQDKELFVPLATTIQERTCIDPLSKKAVIGAQQFERLMTDIVRLGTSGVTADDAKPANDLGIFPNDTPVSKDIQEIRIKLDALKKGASPGEIIDTPSLLTGVDFGAMTGSIKSLFDDAIAAQTDPKKIDAVTKLQTYAAGTAKFHIDRVSPPAQPAAAIKAAPSTP